MSLARGLKWAYKDIELVGYSLAGISTSICFPKAGVCFDVAQGLPFQVPYPNILLTHGHLDHAGGLPYLLGQKAMMSQKPAQVYMPEALLSPMQQILDLWAQIEQHTYAYALHAVRPGDSRALSKSFTLKVFPTFHRVPSQGYALVSPRKRLKPEFSHLPPAELGRLRRKGTRIEEPFEDVVIAFTGDTRSEVLDHELVRRARVLLIEVTYWDERKPIASAREWGHIHLDELLPRLNELTCEKILLIHTSARYRTGELNAILDRKLSATERERVELFPREA